MSVIVMKFGGTSVGDIERIRNAATKVAAEVARGHKVAVVVSAMAKKTDELIGFCRAIDPHYGHREGDVVTAAGEQITSGLMALALQAEGLQAQSWQGWQAGLKTDAMHGRARIIDFQADELSGYVRAGKVAVMAGFQGIAGHGAVTTLGRGGSDTSAVALAIALKADRCDFYKDVKGIYTANPAIVKDARRIDRISYHEMLELAGRGSKVLDVRSVGLAMDKEMPIQVLSSFDGGIGSDFRGTLVKTEDEAMERNTVAGIACATDQAEITLFRVPDQPGVAGKIFVPLAGVGISVDMIGQTAQNGDPTNMTFSIAATDLPKAIDTLSSVAKDVRFADFQVNENVAKLSVIGIGMRNEPGVAARLFEALGKAGINMGTIHTSESVISVVIDGKYAELAQRVAHEAYGLHLEPEKPHANSTHNRRQSRSRPGIRPPVRS